MDECFIDIDLVIHISLLTGSLRSEPKNADEVSTLFSKTAVSRVVEPKAVATLVECVMHNRLTIKVDISTSYCGGFRSVRW